MRPDGMSSNSRPMAYQVRLNGTLPSALTRFTENNPMDIKEHMEVIGADGVHVGTVDKVEGSRIKDGLPCRKMIYQDDA